MRPKIDPPDPKTFPMPQWATWVDYRHPQFKVHKTLGMAKGSLTTSSFRGYGKDATIASANAFLYEFAEGAWHLRHSIHPGDDKNHHPLWNQYVIPEYEEPVDWQKKLKTRKKTA